VIGEIFYTDEFGKWFAELSADDQDAVAHLVELLGQKWLALGHPYSSEIKGSRYALRELRSQKRKPIRVLYAFSPERNAILLIGGDKTGNPRFYDEIVPRAEGIWEHYLQERRRPGGASSLGHARPKEAARRAAWPGSRSYDDWSFRHRDPPRSADRAPHCGTAPTRVP
jgi:hypothetical protein